MSQISQHKERPAATRERQGRQVTRMMPAMAREWQGTRMMPKSDEQLSNSSTLAANAGDLFTSIIYALRDNSRYAYHYTSAEKALNFILKDCTLLLNSFNATNDPKESKCWELSAFSTQNPAPEAMHDNQLRLQVAERLKRGVFVACFSSDSEGLNGDHTQDILLRGLARPRMWLSTLTDTAASVLCLIRGNF